MDFEERERPELSEAQLAVLRERADQLEVATRKIGLYAQNLQIGAAADPLTGEPINGVILGSFLIGDLAYSDRVQNPQAEGDADTLAAIETGLMRDRVRDLRDRMIKRKGGDDDGQQDAPDA